ncbi:MAG: acylneuraminate cytidylyltransferase family protein [Solirubrobacteraceae bacterium]
MSAVLGLIPARGGSKGLPGKNLRRLDGASLVELTHRAALASEALDRVILSTDDEAIAEAGRAAGVEVPFMRPADLAGDAAPMLAVVQHAITALEAELEIGWVVILQPTSPLRRPEDVRGAVELARSSGADSVVGVVELPLDVSPDYVMRVDDGRLVPFLERGADLTRRQEARPAYKRDGTVYVVRRDVAVGGSLYGDDCRPYLVDSEASLSIDTAADWREAERRLA